MRLALIANRFQRNDGQGLVNYEGARAALDRGYQVTLVTAYCADEIARHPNARLVLTGNEKLPTQMLRNLAFANDSARWLRKHRAEFDLVQANGFITWEPCDIVTAHFVHSAWIKSKYFPFPASSLSPYAIYQRAFTRLNARWEKRAFLTARRVIAVSENVGRQVAALGVPADRIQVIYNGVDTDEFHPGAPDRARFKLPEGVPLALFVGEIRTPRKNLDTVLRAMQALPELHLAVAAETRDSPMPALARELGVADRVHFLGKISGIAALMRSVDLFVFPSRYEAHPLVVMEAMASGLPVVVSGNFGAADFVGDAGRIFEDPDDVAALTGLISELLADPEERQALGEKARQRSLTMKWSIVVEEYLAAYEALAAHKPPAQDRT